MQTEKKLLVGKIGAVYGVKGWNKVISFTEPATNILDYLPWQLRIGTQIKTVDLTNTKIQNPYIVVQINNCNDRDIAKQYTGAEIFIERDQLAPLTSEYYWNDLIGLQVVTKDNFPLGKVEYLLETGSNDVLVIQGEKRHLVPFLPDSVILEINMETKVIRVDWDPEF